MLKKITCPICARRLFDTDESERVHIYPADEGAPELGRFYVKCSKCASTWAAILGRGNRETDSKPQNQIIVPEFSIPVEELPAGKINIQITYKVQS